MFFLHYPHSLIFLTIPNNCVSVFSSVTASFPSSFIPLHSLLLFSLFLPSLYSFSPLPYISLHSFQFLSFLPVFFPSSFIPFTPYLSFLYSFLLLIFLISLQFSPFLSQYLSFFFSSSPFSLSPFSTPYFSFLYFFLPSLRLPTFLSFIPFFLPSPFSLSFTSLSSSLLCPIFPTFSSLPLTYFSFIQVLFFLVLPYPFLHYPLLSTVLPFTPSFSPVLAYAFYLHRSLLLPNFFYPFFLFTSSYSPALALSFHTSH